MRASMTTFGIPSQDPREDHPLAARREPSALEGWILEVLYCDPKVSRAFMRFVPTEGRDFCLR